MKKKYLSNFKVKDKTIKTELTRAHAMIVLLVVAFMFMLTLSSSLHIVLDPVLTFIVVVLLAVVGLISLSVVITLIRKR